MSETIAASKPLGALIGEPSPTWRSERALDATTFCLADVADGLGPFLVIYLTTGRHWTATDAGYAMSAMLIGTVLSQTFVGAWIDHSRAKRQLIAVAAILVAIATVTMYYLPTRPMILGLQFTTGTLVTVFPPAIAAISLGIVGRTRLAARAGRNEACFHGGNVFSAGLVAILAWCFGNAGVFYGVAAMALASAVSVLMVREADIDHDLARGSDAAVGQHTIAPLSTLWRDHRIAFFVLAVVLFHFANAAMLPLVGQKLGHSRPESAQSLMAACIIVAQLAMVPVALWASYQATQGRRFVLLVGFAILPIRGMLYTLTDAPALLIANQILDGVGAGIYGVVALLVMADLTKGTGRFNFALGLAATATGLGAAFSNAVTGKIVDAAGYSAGFLSLSAVAVLAFVVLFTTFKETKQA
jgi:MFS family permease